jgi:putative SOS response-associated peptidase YedK
LGELRTQNSKLKTPLSPLPVALSLTPHSSLPSVTNNCLMCGRFSQSKTAEMLIKAFQLSTTPSWQPRYNIAPTQDVPTVLYVPDQPGRQFKLLRWGLIPGWSKDLSIGYKLINARAETLTEKPAFRSAFKRHRCLILADGFYEWQRLNGKKQPYYFRLANEQPFAFAGLWERWQKDETTIESCTIITTQANALLRPVHDRMPVVLEPETYDPWLDPSTSTEQLQSLLRPYNSQAMEGYPVSSLVNSPSNESPNCLKRL